MKNNKIPRQFDLLVGKILVDTNVSKVNDILHITKSENGYTALNTRTKETAFMFVSIMRNSEIFELVSVQ